MTRIVVTSDFHGYLPPDVPACDLLLVGGDVLGSGGREVHQLGGWLARQDAKSIVGVAGNHDFVAKRKPGIPKALPWVYLENETTVVEGLRVFGSPLSMPFGGWEFMLPEHELEREWEKIPDDVDVLMVHGPAEGILDRTRAGVNTGSRTLRKRIGELPNLKLFVTGHIHEEYGTAEPMLVSAADPAKPRWLRCVNGSYMNERYRPGNPPIVIDL